MGLRRQLTSEGIAHANADSKTHARHVQERKRQREIEWLPEIVSDENPSAEFKLRANGLNLSNGLYFTGAGAEEKAATGPEFEQHLAAINWERRWNFAQMKRGQKMSTVRRQRKQPAVGETIVNLSPWQMTFINRELERWENAGISSEKRTEMLQAWLQPLRLAVTERFRDATGWDVLGSYVHLDSNKVHFGVTHSRVSKENQLIGEKYPRTIGPWSVAQWRIQQVGASDPADTRLRQNFEKFHERHGPKTAPLDIQLHAAMDVMFNELISSMGTDAEMRYDAAKEHYRAWKTKNRRDFVVRSPSSMRVSWDVIRLLSPLLPPQVQATIRLARNAYQAFQVIGAALDASAATSPSVKIRERDKEI